MPLIKNPLEILIKWEWDILKKFKRKKKSLLIRLAFALFSAVSIVLIYFSPPFIFIKLFTFIEMNKLLSVFSKLIIFIAWYWFISPKNFFYKYKKTKNF